MSRQRSPRIRRRGLIDGMRGGALSGCMCRDLLSSGACPRRRFRSWSVRRQLGDDRNGTRSAPSADHRRVAGHRARRDRAPSRRSPTHRARVRRFAERFRGQEHKVALEATTGRRSWSRSSRQIGARAHLAEPAETAARRGIEKRAKSDRADAPHLRELVMVGRLPESWIPPEHLLDLRARVRLRHALVDQRREWRQRIQATLYHHGVRRAAGEEALQPAGPQACAGSPPSRRCTAAGSRHAPAATTTWPAFIDTAAAPRHGTAHQPSCRRSGASPARAISSSAATTTASASSGRRTRRAHEFKR
jgi:hypothetical protein